MAVGRAARRGFWPIACAGGLVAEPDLCSIAMFERGSTDEGAPGQLRSASPLLLQSALSGLLCLSLVACSAEPSSGALITAQQRVDKLDEAGFTKLCDARHGTVEVMPHCGGFATAKGFSYDLTTQMLSEHSCKGGNTCAGWNCVTNE